MSLIDLYISDGGSIRRIGDNQHDMLTIENGELCYYNLQNGDGCRLGEDGEWYKFVDNVDEYGYNCDPRKTENSSEKPNNCEDCRNWNHNYGACTEIECNYEPNNFDKDINVRSKDEPLTCRNKDHYADCEYKDNCNPVVCFKALDEFREMVTEPQERSE